VSADTWTHVETSNANGAEPGSSGSTRGNNSSSTSSSLTLAVFTSPEWMALQGDNAPDGSSTGLLALQTAFLNGCKSRLFAPLRHLFPEAVSVDENGIAIPCLPFCRLDMIWPNLMPISVRSYRLPIQDRVGETLA